MKSDKVRQEVLACLNATIWKRSGEIREELEKKFPEDEIHQPQVYAALATLQHLELVESQRQPGVKHPYHEYRLARGSKKAKVKKVPPSNRRLGFRPRTA